MSNFRYNITKKCAVCDEVFIANMLDSSDCVCDNCSDVAVDKEDGVEYSNTSFKQELMLELNYGSYRTRAVFYDYNFAPVAQ